MADARAARPRGGAAGPGGGAPRPPRQVGQDDLSLAAMARDHLAAGQGSTAWLYAERLARRRRELVADDLALRALTMAAQKLDGLAWDDLRAAARLDPTHSAVNRLLLRSPDHDESADAARQLVGPDVEAALRSGALTILARSGAGAVGSVERDGDRVRGWIAWMGEDRLTLRLTHDEGEAAQVVKAGAALGAAGPLTRFTRFAFPWPGDRPWLKLSCDRSGALIAPDLLWRDISAPRLWPDTLSVPADRPRAAAVILPVYGDLATLEPCFAALLAQDEPKLSRRIMVVDDATPDRRIREFVDGLARQGAIELIRNPANLGFAASVNRGLAALRPGEDAVLLNSDTLPPPGFCGRLATVAHSRPRIGTVTPLSNNGEYTSFPLRFRENALPAPEEVARWDRLAAEAGGRPVSLPNGIGFCLYVKNALLREIGGFSLAFGRGYGEDTEFCLRASEAGFQHVCATNVVVGHAGARSFRASKRALVVRNLAEIERRYPDYRRASTLFVREDPLRPAIAEIERRALVESETALACFIRAPGPDRGEAGRYASLLAPHGVTTLVATIDCVDDRLRMELAASGGEAPQSATLAFEGDGAAGALARELRRLPIARMAVLDPDMLPRAVAGLVSRLEIPDVIVGDAEPLLSPKGKGRRGLLALGEKADTIVATSDRLAETLREARPDIAARIRSLPPLPPVPTRIEPDRVGDLLLVTDGDEPEADQIVLGVASRLRKSASDARLVVDGAMGRDHDAAQLENLFVLGPGRSDLDPLRRRAFAGVLFLSRRWSLGDPRVEAAGAAGLAVGYVDPTATRSIQDGTTLRVSVRDKPAAAASAILRWREAICARSGIATPDRDENRPAA